VSTRYLLPCSCGRKVSVAFTQAGQEIQCACGAVLEIPTMRGLVQLERAPTQPPTGEPSSAQGRPPSSGGKPVRAKAGAGTSTSAWGARQRLLLVGALLTVVGCILTAVLYIWRPRLADVESLAPHNTWRLWQDLRYGVEYRPPWEELYFANVEANNRWMIVTSAVAVVGVLTIASSLLVSTRRARRPARRPPQRAKSPGPKAGRQRSR
jgi:hypothetical protein